MRGFLLLVLLLTVVLPGIAAEDPVLQRITLADGRVLEGVLDEKAATIQLYNLKTGKPLAVLPIKLADITAREPVALNKAADGDTPAAGDDAKPKAKRGADGRFLTNHPAALKLAKELNRPVFAFFTGSDWCPVCQRMQKEVLMTPAFRTWAEAHVVLLEIDSPHKEQPKAVKEQSDALKRQYGVSSFPTVHLLGAADGKTLGSISGLFDGGTDVYISELIRRIPAAKLSK
ncbi:MAG TPA: thioredoxin fold domain-containing protein [Planctomycetota bacterium]|jgi:thiol-disulfide isomerase/thioredoxin|nr:thioredoxin fold domain-containing protein [Planctomycetota bacterium]